MTIITKRFNGDIFHSTGRFETKTEAKEEAIRWRGKGYYYRITKEGNRIYILWIRG